MTNIRAPLPTEEFARRTAVVGSDLLRSYLLLHSLYDAGQHAERVAFKIDIIATALRRQFISYDSAVEWLQRLKLLDYVNREQFRYE